MAKIERFEEIKAWQLGRVLVKDIYRLTQRERFSKDFGLRDQIRRAAISVVSNIAEGFERYTRKEFAQFLNIARGSVAEVRSQLYIAYDLGYVSEPEFLILKDQCENISRHIWSFMKYLKADNESV